jgi:hypothetical protein
MVELELTMTAIQFPAMRQEVIAALRALADPQRQRSWGKVEQGVSYYDDLTLNVHILYDDCQVLPDPSTAVGSVLARGEVDALRAVHDALNPLLEDLIDKPDGDYLMDPRWPTVIAAASEALRTMAASER